MVSRHLTKEFKFKVIRINFKYKDKRESKQLCGGGDMCHCTFIEEATVVVELSLEVGTGQSGNSCTDVCKTNVLSICWIRCARDKVRVTRLERQQSSGAIGG